jgi:hypothetical protein
MTKRVLIVYIVVAVAYTLLALLLPTDPKTLEQYKLSEFRMDLLQLSLVVPVLAIWFAAFYGYDKFSHYARTIAKSKDGNAFRFIANGLGVLAFGLAINAILGSILNYLILESPRLTASLTIVRNYSSMLMYLIAFWLIRKGTQELLAITPRSKNANRRGSALTMLSSSLAVLYTFLIFQNPNRQIPDGPAVRATYYLPDWLILLTIILPYLYIWMLGFQAVINIYIYMKSVKGVLYRQMLELLAKGLAGIILISIILQLLVNFGSLFRSMALGPLLLIVYLLVAGIAVGFIYVAAGAKRLQKIEDV